MYLNEQETGDCTQQLQRTILLLVHASSCKDANCSSSLCSIVKENVNHHVATCQKNIAGSCPLCRCANFVMTGIVAGVHSPQFCIDIALLHGAAGAMTKHVAAACEHINIITTESKG